MEVESVGDIFYLAAAPVSNDRTRRNAERSLERFNRTKQRVRAVEKRSELPRDHAGYSRPLAEMPAQYPPRSRLVEYPPVETG